MASFKSVLQKIGSEAKTVFKYLASPQGQKVVATGEAVAEGFGVPAGLVNLANAGLNEILKVEALAQSAGAQNGSGAEKLSAVTAAVTPAVLEYAQSNGLPKPTATEIQNAVNGLVAFANALNSAK